MTAGDRRHMLQSQIAPFCDSLLARLGDSPQQVQLLARGASCTVWQIDGQRQSYALRVLDQAARELPPDVDVLMRDQIRRRGGRVLPVLCCSDSMNRTLEGRAWTLEPVALGAHPERGAIPARACRELGETLAALHQVAADRYGRPHMVDRGVVIGSAVDPAVGAGQRFDAPLPDLWPQHDQHPVLAAAPELKDDIIARLRDVTAHVRQGHAVLCHSDLHERQFICAEEGLVALIDFGDVSLLDRHWDLGSFHYFHGAAAFDNMHAAYQACVAADSSAELARLYSIAIAMHHGARSRLPGKEHRLARATAYIRNLCGRA